MLLNVYEQDGIKHSWNSSYWLFGKTIRFEKVDRVYWILYILFINPFVANTQHHCTYVICSQLLHRHILSTKSHNFVSFKFSYLLQLFHNHFLRRLDNFESLNRLLVSKSNHLIPLNITYFKYMFPQPFCNSCGDRTM